MKKCKEWISLIRSTLHIVHKLNPAKVPVMIGKAICRMVLFLLTIAISVELINLFMEGKKAETLYRFLMICLAGRLLFMLVQELLEKLDKLVTEKCHYQYQLQKSRLSVHLPYLKLQDPEIIKIRSRIHTNEAYGIELTLLFQTVGQCMDSFVTLVTIPLLMIPLMPGTGLGSGIAIPIYIVTAVFLSVMAASVLKKTNENSMKAIMESVPERIITSDYLLYEGGISYKDGKDIRLSGLGQVIQEYCQSAIQEMMSFEKVSGTMVGLGSGLVGMVKIVILGSAYMVIAIATGGKLETGTVLMLAAFLAQIVQALMTIMAQNGNFQNAAGAIRLYDTYVTMGKDEEKEEGKSQPDKITGDYRIEFRDVSFRYPGKEAYALQHLSCQIEKGIHLAIVGPNGSGKTTFILLLCGLLKPTEGTILFNGLDVSQLSLTEYQKLFSVVFQDFSIFALPLSENIAASQNYQVAAIEESIRRAGLSEFYEKLPNRESTILYKDYDDGVVLSGGEAQKVALARALYRDAPIFILDEPTAALDPIAELEIFQYMQHNIQEKTAVFISHRLSACKLCETIMVMNEGKLVQEGNHDTLLKDSNSLYAAMWNAQAQYYQ
ncbi:MAG: ABC transporter ATP-binding protein/permease [Lachnospiraceae bacterium]|nr:ABC transporter ATP-binding protein/permease [Lachnospiraceae bacterium]